MHLAFLYSRYPVISQTFCDTEMLALERRGWSFEIASIHPPLSTLRHEHAARLRAPIYYAPPQEYLKIGERRATKNGSWPVALIAHHEQRYGTAAKPALRARNAVYLAQLFVRHGVQHCHVHFANRAAHTALFVKAISGIPFSITAHGQDFMVDLGSLDLLREICSEAEFVAAETDYSARLLRERCPDSAAKIHRVYNGMDLANFPAPIILPNESSRPNELIRIFTVGRLVEFKGFNYLIDACAELQRRGRNSWCEIVGDGPMHDRLTNQIQEQKLQNRVVLSGARSQEEIFARLRAAQIFTLASVVDQNGASDIFPTVILEAMASSLPVVSTKVAGIPESVVDRETGFLVPPNDPIALADALDQLITEPNLRASFGAAARARVQQNFQIETTVQPLEKLFRHSERSGATRNGVEESRGATNSRPNEKQSVPLTPRDPSTPRRFAQEDHVTAARIAFLIDRWPDHDLSDLETELAQLQRRGLEIFPIVCRLSEMRPLELPNDEIDFQFLPDAIVLEAEWQQERELARELEAEHSRILQRVPGAIFLEQARYALTLRQILARENISHLHATSSRALVGALLVRKLFPITISVAVEARPTLPRTALKEMLREVNGGRVFDRRLVRQREKAFLIERRPGILTRLKLDRREKFWQECAQRLTSWSESRT